MENIIVIGVILLVYLLIKKRTTRINKNITQERVSHQAQEYKNLTIANSNEKESTSLQKINTSLMLKRGESAYFEIISTLSETRAERVNQSVFVGKRQKNTFFGGSSGRSKSHQVLTKIDKGRLILTNKRLAFDGAKTNRNIKLGKLMSVEIVSNIFSSDQLELSIEGRQKSMYFSAPDTHKYKELIMQAYRDV